ncbi:MAG TPA: hypothetical protein VFZ66_17715 [Herpetosiphonaceae bacterium]
MNVREVQQHVTILGWLYIIGHALFLVVGGFVFVLLTGIGVASGEPEARTVLSIVGTSIGLLLAALALPGMLAGYGLLKHRPWARVLAIVVGVLGLVNVPIGTAIGLYTFWVLTQEATTEYFATPAPA